MIDKQRKNTRDYQVFFVIQGTAAGKSVFGGIVGDCKTYWVAVPAKSK